MIKESRLKTLLGIKPDIVLSRKEIMAQVGFLFPQPEYGTTYCGGVRCRIDNYLDAKIKPLEKAGYFRKIKKYSDEEHNVYHMTKSGKEVFKAIQQYLRLKENNN